MFLDRLFLAEFDDDQLWSAFHRLRGYAAPPFDASEGHPRVAEGLRALTYEDWDSLEATYHDQSPDDRHHWLDRLGALHPLEKPIPSVPRSVTAWLIAGAVLVGKAWRLRGWADGPDMPEAEADTHRRMLTDAQTLLRMAQSKASRDVVLASFQIRCGLGLGMDSAAIYALEDRLMAADDPCLFADNTMLQCYARKWYGSHEAMWDWAQGRAREERNRAPAWYALQARAEIEHWLYECTLSDVAGADETYLATTRTAGFQDQALALQSDFLAGLNATKGEMSQAQLHYAHNVFGTYFHIFGPNEALRPHLEAIGSTPALVPWIHTGIEDDTLAFLNAARRKAGLKPLLEKLAA